MVTKIKKPTPKGGKAAVKAKKGKVAAKSAKAAATPIEVGSKVIFAEYTAGTPEDDMVYQTGDVLIVKGISGEGATRTLMVVKEVDSDAYDATPDEVDGAEVMETEVKRAKAGKAPKPAPEPIKVTAIGEMKTLLKKGDILATAKEVFEEAKQKFFYFGGLLAKLYHEKLYVSTYSYEDSREGFEKFTEDNFGIKAAVARGYIDIYVTTSAIPNLDVKRLGAIGWSKSAEIAKYMTSDNAEELLSLAEEKPITELKSELRNVYVNADNQTPSGRTVRQSTKMTKTTFKFDLWEDRAASVTYILEAAKKQLGVDDLGDVFEHIANEWATDHLDEGKVAKAAALRSKTQKELKKRGVSIPETASTTPVKPKKVTAEA